MIMSNYITIQLLYGGLHKKRKCGVDFVYLIEGCGKTYARINDTMPHTWIVWGTCTGRA